MIESLEGIEEIQQNLQKSFNEASKIQRLRNYYIYKYNIKNI